ncbi:MAG: chorismate synthase [Candidatus Jacksonbacteria bacterium]
MSNTFGKIFKITTWGESHGKAIGVIVDGCPAGLKLSEQDIQAELDRRRPGQSQITTTRQELDKAEILSGVFQGVTLGTPISILIKNQDAHLQDYEKLKDVYRPGHADYTWEIKYGIRDWRGGGRASGRETVGRVAGGAVARKILSKVGVEIVGYVIQISNLRTQNSKLQLKSQNLKIFRQQIETSIVRCPDAEASKEMVKLIEKVRKEGDSVGGVIEIIATGVPAGWGEPVFDKLSADLAKGLMSVPGVKGVEIGSGFECAGMRGSEHNDSIKAQISNLIRRIGGQNHNLNMPHRQSAEEAELKTLTNNAGGILGGISNGMPIVARIAVKPTSSIAKEQETVDKAGRSVKIKVKGRHDPCICPRIVPVAEAMMALVLADYYLISRMYK